ncbi:hypothetical protein [Aliivibrio fischeri]|uniref:hypothetical protein n=1 Tax=Aliivibrio fischeri TaxID=668 RepID=UPI0007C4EAE0|nr:hypothetical protein [Aliivibrio fischeri]
MAIYIYNKREKTCISQLSEIEIESLKHQSSDMAQDLLARLHNAQQWLACDCCKPFALMYPRKNEKKLTIVNHYKNGIHDSNNCTFFSVVIGTDKEVSDIQEIEDFAIERESSFMLFRGFGGANEKDELLLNSTTSSVSKDRVDTLIRILHNCVDKSYLNYFFGDKIESSNMNRNLMSLRDSSGGMFLKGNASKPLQDIFFVGKKGLEIAENILIKKKKQFPNIRHSAIVILPSTIAEYTSKTKRMSIVNDLNGDDEIQITHLNGIQKPPILSGDISLPYKYPSLIIAAISFKDKYSTIPEALKVAIQPIVGDGSICPVNNYQEAIFFRVANKLIHQELSRQDEDQGKIYISKQLFSFLGDKSAKPSIVLTNKTKDHRKSIYIEILASNSQKDECDANNRLAYLNKITSSETALVRMVMDSNTTDLIQLTIEQIKNLIIKVKSNEKK